jgi:hypothetical protein
MASSVFDPVDLEAFSHQTAWIDSLDPKDLELDHATESWDLGMSPVACPSGETQDFNTNSLQQAFAYPTPLSSAQVLSGVELSPDLSLSSQFMADSFSNEPLQFRIQDIESDLFTDVEAAVRELVEAHAAADSRSVSMKEKKADAAILLHLQRLINPYTDDTSISQRNQTPSESLTQESSGGAPGLSNSFPTPMSTSTSFAGAQHEAPAARPVSGGVELVFDMNLNASIQLPKKQRPRTKAQRESYSKVRKHGACEKHKRQHKKVDFLFPLFFFTLSLYREWLMAAKCNCLESFSTPANASLDAPRIVQHSLEHQLFIASADKETAVDPPAPPEVEDPALPPNIEYSHFWPQSSFYISSVPAPETQVLEPTLLHPYPYGQTSDGSGNHLLSPRSSPAQVSSAFWDVSATQEKLQVRNTRIMLRISSGGSCPPSPCYYPTAIGHPFEPLQGTPSCTSSACCSSGTCYCRQRPKKYWEVCHATLCGVHAHASSLVSLIVGHSVGFPSMRVSNSVLEPQASHTGIFPISYISSNSSCSVFTLTKETWCFEPNFLSGNSSVACNNSNPVSATVENNFSAASNALTKKSSLASPVVFSPTRVYTTFDGSSDKLLWVNRGHAELRFQIPLSLFDRVLSIALLLTILWACHRATLIIPLPPPVQSKYPFFGITM